jgi:hypothetical protein
VSGIVSSEYDRAHYGSNYTKRVNIGMASPTAGGPQAKPPKDPQPTVDRIDDLARRVLTGDILLPKFQREFVWEKAQVLQLLDSVGRNFPIGSILLWQSRQELRSENRIADLEITLPKPDYPVNYLLDGQQRLSTICGALFWHGKDPDSVWNIAYDLRKREFIHLQTLDDPPQHQIRTNLLADGASFYKHIAILDTLTANDKEALKQHADELFNRFKDYKIAAVTLGDMSLDDVAPIFERINSTGTSLTIVDLMRAATWSPDFDLIDTIDGIRVALADKGFDGLERKALLRNMSAAAGGGFSAESIDDLRKHGPATLKAASADTAEAYKRAVDFLATQIGIPSDAAVPYANQIVVLAEVFRRLPKPTADQYEEIRRWFWRTGISGYFSGWNTGSMATDLTAVANFANGTKKMIDVQAYSLGPNIWKARPFRSNNAHSKVLVILLSYQDPLDFVTGQHIDVGSALSWTNAKEFHHFFPRKFLEDRGYSSARINCLANFVLLSSASNKLISDRAPHAYVSELLEKHGNEFRKWLATNLITEACIDAALMDDFDAFVEARSLAIDEACKKVAAW